MSGEEQITEVENRYSEYKIVSNDETNKFIAYLEKHDNLKVSNSEIDFSIKLKFYYYNIIKILNIFFYFIHIFIFNKKYFIK